MNRIVPKRLQSERLVLRPPESSDALAIFNAYTQDIEVARYMVWRPHLAVAESEAFIAECIQAWDGSERMPYVLAFRGAEQQPIGMLDTRVLGTKLDIGYVLAPQYWGRALMPEAITTLAKAALGSPSIFRVQATCDVDNKASARTLEKSGLIREAVLQRYSVHPNISAEPRDCFMYALHVCVSIY